MALSPGLRLGVYELREIIGAGGPASARAESQARELQRGRAEAREPR